ncbi:hypothetical protein [Renibacterium salmoninarum]|uniref:hypothetical protein n=1 Tax=Renibacterium salmoninarum TaxID=1646 RepID=UPI0005A1F742|nr:hypothetical protein [Renibacterium salmoninarum]
MSAKDYVKPWQSRFGVAAETTLRPWQPRIDTELSAHKIAPGASVADRISVTGMPGLGGSKLGSDSTDNVDLVMYGPLPGIPQKAAEIPPNSPVFQQTSAALTGSAETRITSVDFKPFQQAGCYTVVATIKASTLALEARSAFGEQSETVCVEASTPPSPAVSAATTAAVGTELALTGPQNQQNILAWAAALLGIGTACGILNLATPAYSPVAAQLNLSARRSASFQPVQN